MFTLPEEGLFFDAYFSMIENGNNIFEIQSRKKGFCWKIQKILHPNIQIVVHHKGSIFRDYYFFDSTDTVKKAIELIKKHENNQSYSYY